MNKKEVDDLKKQLDGTVTQLQGVAQRIEVLNRQLLNLQSIRQQLVGRQEVLRELIGGQEPPPLPGKPDGRAKKKITKGRKEGTKA